MSISWKSFEKSDYGQVFDFFVALNAGGKRSMNWNWARWEWGYFHPYFDRTNSNFNRLWLENGRVVGAACCDMCPGEAFAGTLQGYEALLPEIIEYASAHLADNGSLKIAASDTAQTMQAHLLASGFQKTRQTETTLRISLCHELPYVLPDRMTLREVQLPEDGYQYQLVFWKGFGHGNDLSEFEKTLINEEPPRPHMDPALRLAIVDESGSFAAHAQCWLLPGADYAYVEPVCTIPEYRKMGLARAVLSETLNRCRQKGAKEAYVLSDQPFYHHLGFEPYSRHIFYHKK